MDNINEQIKTEEVVLDSEPANSAKSDNTENVFIDSTSVAFTINEADSRKKWWGSFIRASVTSLIAVVMLIMAFLPVVSINFDIEELEGAELKIGSIDIIGFATDSLFFMSSEDLNDSVLAEKIDLLTEELFNGIDDSIESFSELNAIERSLLNDLMIKATKYQLRHEDTMPTVTLILSAFIALSYLLSAAALLILSILHISALFRLININIGQTEHRCRSLVILTPILALSLLAAIRLLFSKATISGGMVTTLIFGSVALCLLVGYSLCTGFKIGRREMIIRAASMATSVAIMISVLCPVMVCCTEGIFSGRKTYTVAKANIDPSFFNSMYISDSLLTEYEATENLVSNAKEELLTSSIAALTDYSVREIRNGSADANINALLISFTSIHGLYEYSWFFAPVSALCLLAFVGAALALWQALCFFGAADYRKRIVFISRIATVLASILALTSVIVFTSFVKYYCVNYKIENYALYIGAGLIVATVSAVANLFLNARPFINTDVGANQAKQARAAKARNLYSLFDEPVYSVEK